MFKFKLTIPRAIAYGVGVTLGLFFLMLVLGHLLLAVAGAQTTLAPEEVAPNTFIDDAIVGMEMDSAVFDMQMAISDAQYRAESAMLDIIYGIPTKCTAPPSNQNWNPNTDSAAFNTVMILINQSPGLREAIREELNRDN